MGIENNESFSNQLRRAFQTSPEGGLTLEDLEGELGSQSFLAELQTMNLSADEARSVFHLLDVNGEQSIMLEDFVLALLRFNGAASHVDIATLLYESKTNSLRWAAYMEYASQQFSALDKKLNIVTSKDQTLAAHLALVREADILGLRRSNDDAATVTANGEITTMGPGDKNLKIEHEFAVV